jgi:hypothetical protein
MTAEVNQESSTAITVTVQLGNTDNRLKQAEWHEFVLAVKYAIEQSAESVHFFGAPANWDKLQNVAWVLALNNSQQQQLQLELKRIRKEFKQEAVAWTSGTTLFL